jgi:exodeoxyribonuclease X
MNLLFLDTETTGRDENARLVQLAFKCGKVKDNLLYKPAVPITFEAMSVHHITNEAVANLPMLEGIPNRKAEIQSYLDRNIMVAHNAPFDVEILRREGLEPKQVIDTLKVVQNLFDLSMYKLQFLRYNFGLEVTQVRAHDAEGDIEVLEALFNYLFNFMARQNPGLGETEIINQMLKWTAEPLLLRKISFGKYTGKKFEDIPKDYLTWLSGQSNLSEDLKFTIKHYLSL